MNEDYISELSYEEKEAFVKIFCILIKADGNINDEEVAFLKKVASRYGIDNSSVVQIIKNAAQIDYRDEALKIKSRNHALELVKECCILANIDDNLHDKELDIIIDIARAMGIEDEKIVLINRLALDSLILGKTERVIMEKDNG